MMWVDCIVEEETQDANDDGESDESCFSVSPP